MTDRQPHGTASQTMSTEKNTLTLKQRRFVEEYTADDGNAVQAYFRAFGRYTSKGTRRSYKAAQASSSLLLSNPIIKAEVQAAQEAYAAKVRVSKLRVIRETAALAFADIGDLFERNPDGGLPRPRDWDDVPPATRKAVQSVKVKRRRLKSDDDATEWEVEEIDYKLYSKTDALEKLCKRLGLFDVELKDLAEQLADLTKQFRERNREQSEGGDTAEPG